MTNEETAEKIRAWCRKGRGHFSWPTDGCGYKQHIRFVRYKAKHWNLWLDLGGDANGFVYNWRDIYELLKEKEEEDE